MLSKLSWQHEFDCNEGDVVVFNKAGREYFGYPPERYIIQIIKRVTRLGDPEGVVVLDGLGLEAGRIRISYTNAIKYLTKLS